MGKTSIDAAVPEFPEILMPDYRLDLQLTRCTEAPSVLAEQV